MTDQQLYLLVKETSIHVKSRQNTLSQLGDSDRVIAFLMKYSFRVNDPIHVTSCVLLQDILAKDIGRITPYLPTFLAGVTAITNESSRRLISRICWLVSGSKRIALDKKQEQQLVEVALLWLSTGAKVATASFAMDILMNVGHDYKEDILLIAEVVEMMYSSQTVAYQSKAKKFIQFSMSL